MKGVLFLFSGVFLLAATGGASAADLVVGVSDRGFEADARGDLARIVETIRVKKSHDRVVLVNDRADNLSPEGILLGGWQESYARANPNGDMHVLWGNLDDAWTEREFDRFYTVMKWLVKRGFRTLLNPVAYENDLRAAAQHPTTSGLIWSSHGDTAGRIFDAGDNAITRGAFADDAGPRFRHLVLSNCYGEATVKRYRFPKGLTYHHWYGETTTTELFNYLESNWSNDLEKDLAIKLPTSVPVDKP